MTIADIFAPLGVRIVAGPPELNLGVWRDGMLLGTQGVSAQAFLTTRTGETGSWLGRKHRGQVAQSRAGARP